MAPFQGVIFLLYHINSIFDLMIKNMNKAVNFLNKIRLKIFFRAQTYSIFETCVRFALRSSECFTHAHVCQYGPNLDASRNLVLLGIRALPISYKNQTFRGMCKFPTIETSLLKYTVFQRCIIFWGPKSITD